MRLRSHLLIAAVLISAALGAVFLARPGRAAPKRVVVLGFDGADAKMTERLLSEGKLPNLAKLRERGTYGKLMPTNPAQSPVSWASISTGTNPGKHGIYDFLARDCSAGESPAIKIGLVNPEADKEILPSPLRGLVVLGLGALGCILGAGLAWLVLARIDSAWRRGGRLQAAACLPGAIFSVAGWAVLSWVPAAVPQVTNNRKGTPFWQTLDQAGVRCVALEAPVSFPADTMHHGACLAGLGVPDMQQTWGLFSKWSDRPKLPATTETGGTSFFVAADTRTFDVVLRGPPNPFADPDEVKAARQAADHMKNVRQIAHDWKLPKRRASETEEALLRMADRMTCRVPITVDRGAGATVTLADGTAVDLLPGVWTDLLPITFDVNPLVQLKGRVQMCLLEAGAPMDGKGGWRPFELFVAPVQFDPGSVPPNVPLSSPHAFAGELAGRTGIYHTLGWPEMTSAVKDDWMGDQEFLDHLYGVMSLREERLTGLLERDDWDCLFAVFTEQDRVQHAFYRHIDPEVPSHDPETAARFGPEVDRIYVEMDRIVGNAMETVGDDVEIIVISDHGFAPFRRGVNLTNFLRSKGYQVPRAGSTSGPAEVGQLFADTQWFPDVDWSRTVAYSMGLGNVYLNRVGREMGGIVPPDKAQKVLDAIKKDLLELRDVDGKKVVRNVYFGADLFKGAETVNAPDLVVGFDWGYRVSWQSSLGTLDKDVITDNEFRWSGDHCSVDPPLVQGIWFSSFPLPEGAKPHVEDVAPTILGMFGQKAGNADGSDLR